MRDMRRLRNFSKDNILTVFVAILFALAFAYLEYNYILVDGVPYREARSPVIANLYGYDLLIFIPALALFSFYPLIWQALTKGLSSANLRIFIAVGVGSFLLSLVLKDASWYLLRAFSPISSDPLAHQWIRPSDYTASLLGSAEIWGLRIPLWYIALSPLIIAIFISLRITQSASSTPNTQMDEAD